MRLRADRPVDGELATTMTELSPLSSHQRKYSMSASTSPEVSSQFSAKAACRSRTAGPSTRNMVSRQRRFFLSLPWSYIQ
jgi:hypothetical protein